MMRIFLLAATLVASHVCSAAQETTSRLVVAQSSVARTTDDVRRVLDKHKGAIYAAYTRALRSDPTIQGTVNLSVVIEPDGTVSKCTIASSTLDHPEFERQLLERFRSINFGAKGAQQYVNREFPFSFFSAGAAKSTTERQ